MSEAAAAGGGVSAGVGGQASVSTGVETSTSKAISAAEGKAQAAFNRTGSQTTDSSSYSPEPEAKPEFQHAAEPYQSEPSKPEPKLELTPPGGRRYSQPRRASTADKEFDSNAVPEAINDNAAAIDAEKATANRLTNKFMQRMREKKAREQQASNDHSY